MKKLILVFICLLLAVPCQARIIFVDADTPDNNDGSSWAKAFNYLQDALADANSTGDVNEIRVAQGFYTPDSNSDDPNGSGDRESTFQLINGVAIYGGFAGYWADDPNQRHVKLYETILSGDINTPGDNSDNSFHVVTGNGTNATAILDGFTITAGNANGIQYLIDDVGGGIYNITGNPTLTSCTFSGNSAGNTGGGGMFNRTNSSPTVTDCTFSGNSAKSMGGGMLNVSSSSPTLTNCTFSGNSADYGGGMYNLKFSSPTLSNGILWGNTAPNGAQIYNDGTSSATVSYSDIEGGWAGTGNIDEDPLFIDPNGLDGIAGTADDEEDNVHLSPSGSPCINTGDPSGDYSGQTDIDGQPRVAYGRVDMGADEVFPIAGDFEPDGDVDFADFAIFAGNWLMGVE